MSIIKIGSFNVHNLSQADAQKLDGIAKIIKKNHLDIVAMQEVLEGGKSITGIGLNEPSGQAKALERSLLNRLGNYWKAKWGDPKTRAKQSSYLGKDNRGEGYVFLWNTKSVELPKTPLGKDIDPEIFENYKTDRAEDMIRLIRNPFCGRFVVKDRNVEIRLITTHVVFGKPKAENLNVEIDAGAVTMRRNEFRILAGQIYPRISEYYKMIKMNVPYTLILGDYNLNLRSSGAKECFMDDVICFDRQGREVVDNEYCRIHTVQNGLSTINQYKDGLTNNYDHFSYDKRTEDVVAGNGARVIPAVEQLYGLAEDRYEQYFDEISDHLPIIIELAV